MPTQMGLLAPHCTTRVDEGVVAHILWREGLTGQVYDPGM